MLLSYSIPLLQFSSGFSAAEIPQRTHCCAPMIVPRAIRFQVDRKLPRVVVKKN
jgi:hypothetical protein